MNRLQNMVLWALLKHVVDEGVHDAHGPLGNTSLRMDLLQDTVNVHRVSLAKISHKISQITKGFINYLPMLFSTCFTSRTSSWPASACWWLDLSISSGCSLCTCHMFCFLLYCYCFQRIKVV